MHKHNNSVKNLFMVLTIGFSLISQIPSVHAADFLEDKSTWQNITPETNPAPRRGHTAVLTPEDNEMIIFGGNRVGTGLNNDIWVLKNANKSEVDKATEWRQIFPDGTPPTPREGHAGVFNEKKDIIIFGDDEKEGSEGFLNDTFKLSFKPGSKEEQKPNKPTEVTASTKYDDPTIPIGETTFKVVESNLTSPNGTIDSLKPSSVYKWKVAMRDTAGHKRESPVWVFTAKDAAEINSATAIIIKAANITNALWQNCETKNSLISSLCQNQNRLSIGLIYKPENNFRI